MSVVKHILKIEFPNFFYRFYADDLVVVCLRSDTKIVIETLRRVSSEWNLSLNEKKSAIVPIHSNTYVGETYQGFPIK